MYVLPAAAAAAAAAAAGAAKLFVHAVIAVGQLHK